MIYFICEKIPFNFNAFIIPFIGTVVSEKEVNNTMLLNHENIHHLQVKREGLFPFLKNYISEHNKNGYDGNFYEKEARFLSGENQYAINNYTNAIRKGKAFTTYNPNFRK